MRETAACVVIGNEILSGKIADSNSHYLAVMLRERGVALRKGWVVPDEFGEIIPVIREARDRFDWVFTSGGVGPTHDDITIEAIARALDRKLVVIPEIAAMLAPFADQPGHEARMRMALAPEGFFTVTDDALRFPVIGVENIFILPGVPEIFRQKVDALRFRFDGRPVALTNLFLDVLETTIAALLEEAVASFEGVEIGSYPVMNAGDYSVKVTVEASDATLVEQTVAFLLERFEPAVVRRVERASTVVSRS
ncbi:MAG: competence/damage-inducible protein A [Myxococcales bacterium]|nr:competence/damage-inducible protein A [Myxococcales bacterium]